MWSWPLRPAGLLRCGLRLSWPAGPGEHAGAFGGQ